MPFLAEHIDHFRARVLQDALSDATARAYERRAQAFEAAAPRPGDYNGNASAAELAERRARCLAIARSCRQHVWLLRDLMPEPLSDDVRGVLAEVA